MLFIRRKIAAAIYFSFTALVVPIVLFVFSIHKTLEVVNGGIKAGFRGVSRLDNALAARLRRWAGLPSREEEARAKYEKKQWALARRINTIRDVE